MKSGFVTSFFKKFFQAVPLQFARMLIVFYFSPTRKLSLALILSDM